MNWRARARVQRKNHMAVLAVSAGLVDETPLLSRHFARDGFLVGHARPPHFRRYTVFALQPVQQDFEVEFAHGGNQQLAAVFIEAQLQGRILVGQLA